MWLFGDALGAPEEIVVEALAALFRADRHLRDAIGGRERLGFGDAFDRCGFTVAPHGFRAPIERFASAFA